jgi:capsular polysaccharide transport system permease protein
MNQPAQTRPTPTANPEKKKPVPQQAADKPALMPTIGAIPTLPGNHLSSSDAPPEREIYEVSVAMLPLQYADHLENFADNFGAGWLDPENRKLRLQFHLIVLFANAKTDGFWLSVSGADQKIPLFPTCVSSPMLGQRHPLLSWATQCRFVVDEMVELPDWAISSVKFELWTEIAGKAEKVGVVYFSEAFTSADKHNSFSKVPSAAPQLAPKITAASIPVPDKKNPLLANRIIERLKTMNRLFLLTVVLPTLISSIYFGLIASDVYISESRFVVRSPQHQTNTGLGALLQGSGFSRSQDDTYTIHDYIFSRDALKKLDDQFAVGKAYSSSSVDLFSRFAGLGWDNSFEALYRYYQKHVTVDLDTLSSISTLSVSAFTPTDAYQLNEKLLEMGENLVNQLNERGRQDMIHFASAEVATAEQKAKAAALAVSNYRNLKGVFDPEKQSALQLQQVSKLQDELIATEIQLAQIRTLTQDNPQIPALQKQLETLQSAINSETAKVAGGNRSLANKSTDYEGLMLERGFAEKQLAAALTSLEQARNDAQRKQLYLERIVQPSKPDVAIEPRRIRNVFATFVLGLIAWGILTMLLAGIREHQD